jgi:membrane-bound lytic murein transglycosylase D
MTARHRRPRAALLVLLASTWLVGCASIGDAPAVDRGTAAVATRSAPSHIPPPAPPIVDPAAAAATAPLIPLPAPIASEPATPLAPLASPGTPPATSDPLRTLAGVDDDDPAARSDLWQRLRGGLQMPDLSGDLVQRWEQWYASRPDYVRRMTERGGRYLFHIVEEVERRGLPAELALLPFIESAFNPTAMSNARASGIWQFMPATGRDFELRQNLFRDDRRSVLESTRAALDYLVALHKMFGDWHLALAAYNWGQGNVQRAIKHNQRKGLPTGYADLTMPAETRNYVPKLQAVKNIVLAPQSFGLALPPLENHPFFMTVPIERDIDVALAARLSGLPLDEFQALNPQHNKPVILAAGTQELLLPYDNANLFVRALRAHRGPTASWTAWRAPRTMRPGEAAKAVGMSEDTLREVNRIPPRMLVRANSALLVRREAGVTQDVSAQVADQAMLALAPERVQKAKRKDGKAVASAKSGKPSSKAVASAPKRQKAAPAQRTRVAQAGGAARR